MIKITKGAAPKGLEALRKKCLGNGLSDAYSYKKLDGKLKKQVRAQMLEEQGQLCAYCMCRIPRTDVEAGIAPIKIEHVAPENPRNGCLNGLGLAYSNLLAVCNGNVTRSNSPNSHTKEQLTCDSHKGNMEFRKLNPCNENTLSTIYYDLNGKILAADVDIQFDLDKVLNLNCPDSPICSERKSALSVLQDDLGNIAMEDLLSYCQILKNEFLQETNPKTPYVGILLWYLQDMENALSKN